MRFLYIYMQNSKPIDFGGTCFSSKSTPILVPRLEFYNIKKWTKVSVLIFKYISLQKKFQKLFSTHKVPFQMKPWRCLISGSWDTLLALDRHIQESLKERVHKVTIAKNCIQLCGASNKLFLSSPRIWSIGLDCQNIDTFLATNLPLWFLQLSWCFTKIIITDVIFASSIDNWCWVWKDNWCHVCHHNIDNISD